MLPLVLPDDQYISKILLLNQIHFLLMFGLKFCIFQLTYPFVSTNLPYQIVPTYPVGGAG